MSLHRGRCHCGKVSFEVETNLEGLIECNCSHCYRKGFVLSFVPRGSFRLIEGEGETISYFFNQHKIEHQFCKTCGVQPFGFGKAADGSDVVAINIRSLEDVEPWSWSAKRVDGRSF